MEKEHCPAFSLCILCFCLKPPYGGVSILLLTGEDSLGDGQGCVPPKHLEGEQLCSLGLMAQSLAVSHALHRNTGGSCMHTLTHVHALTCMHAHVVPTEKHAGFLLPAFGQHPEGCVMGHFLLLAQEP